MVATLHFCIAPLNGLVYGAASSCLRFSPLATLISFTLVKRLCMSAGSAVRVVLRSCKGSEPIVYSSLVPFSRRMNTFSPSLRSHHLPLGSFEPPGFSCPPTSLELVMSILLRQPEKEPAPRYGSMERPSTSKEGRGTP